MSDVTPAPTAEMSEAVTNPSVTPAAPAETVQKSPESVSPKAEASSGQEGQEQAAPDEALEKKPSEAELARKQRNQERWRQMKQAQSDANRREQFYLSEIERLKKQQPDFASITDPDEALAARTAQHLRRDQVQDYEAYARQASEMRAQALDAAWHANLDEMRARAPDFDTVFDNTVDVHPNSVPFIKGHEKGAEIAYWLGQNRSDAKELAGLFAQDPGLGLMRLGEIAGKISAPPPKQVSTAPKPIPALNGGINPVSFDAKSASVEETAKMLKAAGIIR